VYEATFQRDGDAHTLHNIFSSEDKAFPNNRAHYTTTAENNTLTVHVEATDTKALKAVTNSITTILDIYDKSKRLPGT
jgi:tRNA threonylcarbamoyladenosine modification (KEOPS) complex  Pcc1 subunit